MFGKAKQNTEQAVERAEAILKNPLPVYNFKLVSETNHAGQNVYKQIILDRYFTPEILNAYLYGMAGFHDIIVNDCAGQWTVVANQVCILIYEEDGRRGIFDRETAIQIAQEADTQAKKVMEFNDLWEAAANLHKPKNPG